MRLADQPEKAFFRFVSPAGYSGRRRQALATWIWKESGVGVRVGVQPAGRGGHQIVRHGRAGVFLPQLRCVGGDTVFQFFAVESRRFE